MAYRALVLFAVLAAGACGGTQSSKQPVGGACAASGDCQVGLFCDTDDPGGLCTKTCATDADCGTGAVCNDEKKCYTACTGDGDCKRGAPWACVGALPRQFCDVELPDGGSND